MEEVQVTLLSLSLAILFFNGVESSTFTFKNNCLNTVWPATLAGVGSQLASTGFELASQASYSLNVPPSWSGRVWGRTFCSNVDDNLRCATADCGSGQIACNGSGGTPPATLIEFTLAPSIDGYDFYDISLVDGFNLPVSVTPQGDIRSSGCNVTSCAANINHVCPQELQVIDRSWDTIISCKSACLAFNQSQYCCTGDYGSPTTCRPTKYSKVFKGQCPQAYSYAYDDKTSMFTCAGGANYLITFCP